ncbi:glucose and ribitol dehydrogenase-like protein 1-like [Gossypium australe]|uniref:Glucose and ribitol dehydrogenase-like protein 1-like n=1 Tax=Gossypium australe TaxID=47621 RepID=A0A5B6VT94_9ROSI|nr:glucose and ribitol dehydrogenase-like protein 1-like [Gossypium australe]
MFIFYSNLIVVATQFIFLNLRGAIVAFTYVKAQEDNDAKDTLEMLKKDKTSDAKDPMAVPADLGSNKNCKQLVDNIVKVYSRIDILVNNAAEQYESSVEDQHLALLLYYQVMLLVPSFYKISKMHALKHMKEGSSIIHATSVNAYLITQKPRVPLWLSLEAFHFSLSTKAFELMTPLIPASFDKEKTAHFGNDVSMKRVDHPIEVAPCYVFLACIALPT